MTTTKTKTVSDDLRARLGSCESRQQELLAERSEIAYAATVEKQKAAVARLAELNAELSALTNETSVLEAALKESHRREIAAEEHARAEKRRNDAREAEAICSEAEQIAEKLDKAFAEVRQHAVHYEEAMTKVRRLSGHGPAFNHIRVFMARAVMTAVERTPLHVEAVAPAIRTTFSAATASWLQNIRAHLAPLLKTQTKRAA